ncbi:MAG: type I-D CRISPR-associated helicase Cas3' [Cuspidothrix sp.]
MKISLLPLYSKLNGGVGACALGCLQTCKVKQQAPNFGEGNNCPLSSHQAETYAAIFRDANKPKIIFNTAFTGDGKSLAAYLPGLLNPKFRTIGLYPTIELVKDQERQIKNYYELFNLTPVTRIDSLYGAELARRVEATKEEGKPSRKSEQLRRSIIQKRVILTNPDIFHLITHLRYQDITVAHDQLVNDLAQFPNLYVADEFPIFGVHQETAIINSLLLIRHSRETARPLRFLFTSATPKDEFIDQLKKIGTDNLLIEKISSDYISEDRTQAPLGYRQICQSVDLDFVHLNKDQDSFNWLEENTNLVRKILNDEQQRSGRGVIILNSMAMVRRVVSQLEKELKNDNIIVKEVSGIVDDRDREETRNLLKTANQPVLIVGTSAVDVGVDFEINLLIFESSDSATFTQRLGRLGRHGGFDNYQAFALIPNWMNWIMKKLHDKLEEGQKVNRTIFREEIIQYAFDPPREFEQYRHCWGALQSQGMLITLSGANIKGEKQKKERKEREAVTQKIRDRMTEDLQKLYGDQLDRKIKHWNCLNKDDTGKAIQDQLLSFRGSSGLQAAVWDENKVYPNKSRFYTYDLLRLLPHVEVEVITKQEFYSALENANLSKPESVKRSPNEFPEAYIQIYLKIKSWNEDKSPFLVGLDCDYLTKELTLGTLTVLEGVGILGHPQKREISKYLSDVKYAKLLAFLIRVDRNYEKSHWDVSNQLHLGSNVGIYRISDQQDQDYACAFNQDALLLEALKWKLKKTVNTESYIF